MSTVHARLSPSSAVRWFNCAGAPAAEASYEDTSSDAALLGTHAHSLLEHCLSNGLDPLEEVGAWYEDRDVSQETAESVKVATGYVGSAAEGTIVYPEVHVQPDALGRQDCFGTSDVVLWHPEMRRLEVIDYKNGTGYVSEADNLQMLIYLIGAMNTMEITEWPVEMATTIIQPRASGEPVRSCRYDPQQVTTWIQAIAAAATATDNPDALRTPGDAQCQWCKAKGDCPARTEAALGKAREVFAPVMLGSDLDAGFDNAKVKVLTPETVRLILMSKDFIVSVFKDVEEHAYKELEAGRPVPGFKLIEGRNGRSWNLPVEELLVKFKNTSKVDKKKLTQSDYLTMDPVSPAKAENVIKPLVSERTWGNLLKLIDSKPGKPKLVPEGHRKPAVNVTPEDVFQKIENWSDDFLA